MTPDVPRAGHRDERGAAAVFTLLMFSVTLAIVSFVINVGSDRIVRRDLQATADVVALDLARELQGGPAGGNWNTPTKLLEDAKKASLTRQGWHLDDPTKDRFTKLNPDNVQVQMFKRDPAAAPGVDPTQVNLVPVSDSADIPIAVKVTAAGASALRMLPDFWRAGRPSDPHLTTAHIDRSAVAVIGRPLVCISAGATLADLTPGGTLDLFLGRLIGLDRLSIVSPGGVAALDAQIPLGDLATQLGLGTVDEIVTANVTAQSFVVAAATVLSNNGNVAGATVLNAIAARLNGSTSLNVGSILNLNTGTGSAANLNMDAFSLAQAVIQVANKDSFVNLIVPVGVPGLASTVLKAKVIEAPQIACGPVGTKARSAQVQVSLVSDVTALNGLVASAKVDPLLLTAGDGWGTITNISCSVSGSTVDVTADTAAGRLQLHLMTTLLLGIIKLAVDVPDPAAQPNGAAIGSSSSVPMTFSFPAGSTTIPPAQTAGSGTTTLGLSSFTPKVTVEAGLVLNLGSLISSVVVPLLGVVDGVVSPLLNSVFTSLGVRIGTVEIRPTTLPACNEPVLRD